MARGSAGALRGADGFLPSSQHQTRYYKLADNFLAMVQLASMRLWLRAYESTAEFASEPEIGSDSTAGCCC